MEKVCSQSAPAPSGNPPSFADIPIHNEHRTSPHTAGDARVSVRGVLTDAADVFDGAIAKARTSLDDGMDDVLYIVTVVMYYFFSLTVTGDLDECALGLDDCGDHLCVNSLGSYTCACDTGF